MTPNSDRLTPCVLAQMRQVPDPDGPGVIMTYVDQQQTYAQIVPLGTAAYLLGQQVEINAATHKAYMRWVDLGETNEFSVILRERVRPDQTTYLQVFKIHRVLENDGQEWYLELDIELQKQTS